MLYPSLDPNEQFRARRDAVRRRNRRRRAAIAATLLLAVLALAGGMTLAGKSEKGAAAGAAAAADAQLTTRITPLAVATRPRPMPVEVRGVHVTGALASLPGKLDEYVRLTKYGLNTIELDVKDEGGEIAFPPSGVPLARKTGAVRTYYKPAEVVRQMHRKGVYLIGRVVVFQDPYLAAARPDFASAARAGFDEIMLDYVRFPSDGDVANAVYPGRTRVPKGELIASFVAYAKQRLAPLGVRVSTALFGLSATRDMGIGQVPRWISQHVDHVHPMAYPVLYGGGELGIVSPSSEPGETVFRTLVDFKEQVKGSRAQLIPWIQDWNYRPEQVLQQVRAARLQGAKGYLLWNASGLYTKAALAPPS